MRCHRHPFSAELLQRAVNESKGEIQSLRHNVGSLQETLSGHAATLAQYQGQLRAREDEARALRAGRGWQHLGDALRTEQRRCAALRAELCWDTMLRQLLIRLETAAERAGAGARVPVTA
eukprot:gene15583-2940_t